MFFAHISGLGFVRFFSVDGGQTQKVFFTTDVEAATRWPTEKALVEEINGDLTGFKILRIEFI